MFVVNYQPPKSIISQAVLRPNTPVHTISFNCSDHEANEFLSELARRTGGRFHYYSQTGCDSDHEQHIASSDVRSQTGPLTADSTHDHGHVHYTQRL